MSKKHRNKQKKRSRKPARANRKSHTTSAQADKDAQPQKNASTLDVLDDIDELMRRAKSHIDDPELAKELEQLTPDQLAVFILTIEKRMKRRKLQLVGYIVALLTFLLAMLVSILMYANRDPGEFSGWIFLIPFVTVGAVLMLFGRLSRRA